MIAEVLRHGASNGIYMSELTALFNCTDREIRSQVHRERIRGAVILAGNNGFYLPSLDPVEALQEIRDFEHRMKAKAANTLEAVKVAEQARLELENV